MNYRLPADEVLPCLCLQVWLETQDPPRATLCPFSHDAEAWERLWARSRLVLHAEGQVLTCSLSAPCDLPAELVPCWQPEPTGPCQALPGLQRPAVGLGPQEFGGLQPHPNLCVQVWSGGQVRLTQCLREQVLPSRTDDLLLLERGGNASLCALERGACTPLSSFTSTGAGHPGLLEQELRRDVATGQCRQVWHPQNSTGVVLWACPLHKCWLKSLRADCVSEGPLRGRRALLVHAAEPAAERVACALTAALHPLGLAVTVAPGACAGGPQQPCSGNGRCDGNGTRRGTGLCSAGPGTGCSPGYGGPFCAECGDGYYEASRNKSHLVCAECYQACGRCTGPEDSSCLRCKRGWVLHEHRCIDIDECGTEMAHCRANQFCVNTEGSYECRDCSTACIGCMGAGPARCKKCNKGYWRDGAKCLDVDECASTEEPVCTGAQEVCENTEGSYRCVCARGYVRQDGQCVEDKPPEKGFFDDVTEDEVVVLQQMFFGVMICALATLAAKGDMVFTAIFIGAVAAMAGYWLSDRSDRVLDGFMKGR
ncbi:PREDICTED: LOW QUALITY PROTEIN: latent-transforming growth factor beta-binding protein 4-like [Nipponia nippon]|uniref:LOW QUALITY PROTEIN: latent-transforming growth factor beta-binding protein 4-like n=1 Tax=Nipponia nippon TaxID=128390 RepID=UPI000510BD42|nr:PREDICTED: LOW QUALITY PROTEIN: latent-transforming growth factor beta-binding protein 4-like [Nipponia nippon]